MTFASQETSRQQGAPIGLLLFTYGPNPGDYFGYTDAEQTVTYNNQNFLPVPIDRDSVKASGTLDKATIDISLPQDSALNEYFDVWPPSSVVLLTVYQGHVGAADFSVAWAGRVISSRVEDNAAIFSCEPVSTSVRRTGLRRKYGYGCPYVLYGPKQVDGSGCGASKAAATISVSTITASNDAVDLPSGWNGTLDSSKYIAGIAQWTTGAGNTEVRQIIQVVSPTQLMLSGDVSSMPEGATISLTLGCSHQMGDCGSLHNNIPNFGGQPWIPYLNPVGVTNNFN